MDNTRIKFLNCESIQGARIFLFFLEHLHKTTVDGSHWGPSLRPHAELSVNRLCSTASASSSLNVPLSYLLLLTPASKQDHHKRAQN